MSTVVALGFVTALVFHRTARTTPEITADENAFSVRSVDGAQVLELGDGSIVTPGEGARFSVKRADSAKVVLSLESGAISVTAHAAKQQRPFVVVTSLGMIETHDSRFDVVAREEGLAVAVTAGEVEVHGPGMETQRLRSGARWQRDKPREALSVTVPSANPRIEPSATPPPRVRADAATLLEQADAARLARDAASAARLLDELRTRFPSDPNAGLAAFEAGRIHLRSSDPARAASAFRFAVVHADDAFREDAEAGLAQALSETGDHLGCARARDGYIERYPLGAHRARVGALCR